MYEYYSSVELFNNINNKSKFRNVQLTKPIITDFSSNLVGDTIRIYYTIDNGGSNINKVKLYNNNSYIEVIPTYKNGNESNLISKKGVGFNYINFNSYLTDNVNITKYDFQLTDIVKDLYKFSIDVTNDIGTTTQTLSNTIDMTTLGITITPTTNQIIGTAPNIKNASIKLINDELKLNFIFSSSVPIKNILIFLDNYFVNVTPIYNNNILSFNDSNTGNYLSYKNLVLTPLGNNEYTIELILTILKKNNNNYNFIINVSNDNGISSTLVYPSLDEIRTIISTNTPEPEPAPTPTPAPAPEPEPAPTPAPEPAPTPTPAPAPEPELAPTPAPEPAPAPTPAPAPEPAPAPTPAPTPAPEPAPAPTPAPAPFYKTTGFLIICFIFLISIILILIYFKNVLKK